jgi:SulP family sulfate permease
LALVSTSILTALLNYVLGLGIQIVADIAEVPRSLPEFTLPDWKLIFGLVIPAAAIGIIGLVQGAGVSQTFPNPDGKFSDTSRDFLGQGLANIAGAFFRGIPAGGSSSGTAVVVGAGAKSRLANVFAGIAVAIGVLLFADLVEQVALSALAALVIVAGFEMVNRRAIHSVWQTNWVARILMLITFGGTLVMPLQYAVFLGVALSILLFVAQQSNTVRIVEWVLEERRLPLERPAPKTLESHRWTLIHIYGSLFYAAAGAFEESLPDASGTQRAVVILRLRGRDEMGSTVIEVFRRYAKALQDNDGKLILAGVSAPLRSQLERTSLAALIGREWIFDSTDQLGESVNAAIEAAQRWLGQPAPSSSATDSALLTSQD